MPTPPLAPLAQLGDGVYMWSPAATSEPRPRLADRKVDDYQTKGPGIGSGTREESRETMPPNIILLFTWMGASLAQIHRFVQVYNDLYPSATQIIVQTEASFNWSGDEAKKRYLVPVVQALELLGCLPCTNASSPNVLLPAVRSAHIKRILDTPTPRVLVHAFSNGGSWQLATLSGMLSQSHPPTSFPSLPPQPSAMILDSCPGVGGPSNIIASFSGAIRSPILRTVVIAALRLFILYIGVRNRVSLFLYTLRLFLRRLYPPFRSAPPAPPPQTPVDRLKSTLSSPTLLPWFNASTPRLYLYSSADKLTPALEVAAHAADAEKRGLCVRQERFEASTHVSHARVYPERYWAAVRQTWRKGSEGRAGGAGYVIAKL